jgi:hypothetical protein
MTLGNWVILKLSNLFVPRFQLLDYKIPQLLNPYHSPAFIILRILRFIKSRFSALMWLM